MAKGKLKCIIKDLEGGQQKNVYATLRNTRQTIYFQQQNGTLKICDNSNNKNAGSKKSSRRGKTEANDKFRNCECSWKALTKEQREEWKKICVKYNYWGTYKTAHGAWIGLCIRGELSNVLKREFGLKIIAEVKEYRENDIIIENRLEASTLNPLAHLYLYTMEYYISGKDRKWVKWGEFKLNKLAKATIYLTYKELWDYFKSNILYYISKLGLAESNILELVIPSSGENTIAFKAEGVLPYYPYCSDFDICNVDLLGKEAPKQILVVQKNQRSIGHLIEELKDSSGNVVHALYELETELYDEYGATRYVNIRRIIYTDGVSFLSEIYPKYVHKKAEGPILVEAIF